MTGGLFRRGSRHLAKHISSSACRLFTNTQILFFPMETQFIRLLHAAKYFRIQQRQCCQTVSRIESSKRTNYPKLLLRH